MDEFRTSRAVLVALSNYENPRWKLKTPVDDATKLGEVLRAQHGFAIDPLFDEAATLDAIRTYLTGLKDSVGGDDRVLFYFAGHGLSSAEDGRGRKGYILPHDAREDGSNLLAMEELDELLCELTCRHMLVILDCCFAAAYRWANTRSVVIAPGQLDQKRFQWFVEDPAWQAIASAADDELAVDAVLDRSIGRRDEGAVHSPFAAALISGLEGAADIAPGGGDGIITATELFLHVENALLPQGADGSAQKPVFWPLKKHSKGQYVFKTPGRDIDLPEAPKLDRAANPWRGEEPYRRADRQRFFGRRESAVELLGKALDQRVTVLSGASGIGKTSLVEAGLLWRTEAHGMLSVVLEPGGDPFDSLSAALLAAVPDAAPVPSAEQLRTEPLALAAWCSKLRRPVLVVVDQAEQLPGKSAAVQTEFVALLRSGIAHTEKLEAMPLDREQATAMLEARGYSGVVHLDQGRDGSWWASGTMRGEAKRVEVCWTPIPLRVLIVGQSGFEDDLAALFAGDWPAEVARLERMQPAELRRVVDGPAGMMAMRFESDELADDIADGFTDMPGALPVLSMALHQAYLRYLESGDDDRILKSAHYEPPAGGLAELLHARAGALVDAAGERTARRVLERLVALDAGRWVRRRAAMGEFDYRSTLETEAARAFIERLVAARLAVRDGGGGSAYLELAHDTLVDGWPRLQAWLAADKADVAALGRLTPAAEQWRWGGDRELWTSGAQYDSTVRLLRADYPGLNNNEEEFALESGRRARNRSLRWGLGSAFAISAGLVAAWLYIDNGIQIRRAKAELITRNWIQSGNSVSAAAFVTELLHSDPSVRSEELRWGLTRALHEAKERAIVGHDGETIEDKSTGERIVHFRLHVEPEGVRFVVATVKSMRGWDVEGSEFFKTYRSEGVIRASDVAWSTGRIATAEGHEVRVRDWGEGGAAWRFGLGATVTLVQFDPTGTAIVALGDDGVACVWSLTAGVGEAGVAGCSAPLDMGLSEVAWRPDGAGFLGIDFIGQLHAWKLEDGRVSEHLIAEGDTEQGDPHPRQIVVEKNGRFALSWVDYFAIGKSARDLADMPAVLWDLTTSPPTASRLDDLKKVGGATFSPSGGAIAIRSDKLAFVYDVKKRSRVATLVGHNSYIRDIRFSSDEKRIVTASNDHSSRIWDAETGSLRVTMNGHVQPVPQAHLTDDGCYLISMADDLSARVWARDGAWNARLSERPCDGKHRTTCYQPNALSFSASGGLVATAETDGEARIWNLARPSALPQLLERDKAKGNGNGNGGTQAMAIAFSSDDQWLAVGTGPHGDDDVKGELRLYERSPGGPADSYHHVTTVPIAEGVRTLDFSGENDALRLVVARGKGKATVMRVRDGKLETVRPLELPARTNGSFVRAAWSADGSRIAAAVKEEEKGRVCIFEHHASYEQIAGRAGVKAPEPYCRGLTAEPQGLAWAKSGRKLAVSDGNAFLYLWHDADRDDAEKVQLPDDNYAVNIAFVSDDLLAARLARNALLIRSLSLGREVYQRPLPERPLALAARGDGRLLATAHDDRTVHIMALPGLDEMLDMARRDLPRCLEGKERLRYKVGTRTSSGDGARDSGAAETGRGSDGHAHKKVAKSNNGIDVGAVPAWCSQKWPKRKDKPSVMQTSGVAEIVAKDKDRGVSAAAR